MVPDRESALKLFKEYNSSESLFKHALAVESVMRYFAEVKGEDPEKWGVIGLLHDLDYERFPEQHCEKTAEILEERGWPRDYIRAIVSHGWGICTDVEPIEEMEKVLYAIDELTGLITAAVLVRPSKSILDLSVKSVKKKWKTKDFAAKVDRDVIARGAEMLGMEISELIEMTIEGMKRSAQELKLLG